MSIEEIQAGFTLDYGATAKEAVEYAMAKDVYTGGKVNVFNVSGKPEKKKELELCTNKR